MGVSCYFFADTFWSFVGKAKKLAVTKTNSNHSAIFLD